MSITITDEQLAERDRWEGLLMQGRCSLHEALFMCLASGAPASPYLVTRIEAAFLAYQYGGPDADLAQEFGLAISQRERKAMDRMTWASHVRFHVDAFHEQGFSKQPPGSFDDTAFHKAAELLHRSPSQIFDTYYKG